MPTTLHNAKQSETREDNLTGAWIAQRLVILAAAIVSIAPFVLGYVGY